MSTTRSLESIAPIVDRLQRCPPSLVEWTISEDQHGLRLNVQPHNDGLCSFYIEFGPEEVYGLSFGHGLHFENVSVLEFDPVGVAGAIMDGQVAETIWLLFGHLRVKTKGVISLKDGRALYDTDYVFPFLSGLAREKQIQYRAYP